MKYITVDLEKCIGCLNCEFACAFKQNNNFRTVDSNIRVHFYPETRTTITLTCMHCADAWCMAICPADAIRKNQETGAVTIDQSKCAGCKMCMMACPFGNIHFDGEQLVSKKCNLCEGDPNCVKHCISGALQFEEAEDVFDSKRIRVDGKLSQLVSSNRIKIKDGE